jgi:Ca2+-binding RTX toxin-like protein
MPIGAGLIAQLADSQPIGRIETVTGNATITRVDGSVVQATKGTEVFQGDTVETAGNGKVGIVFVDNTTFALGENGQMTLDELVYNPTSKAGSIGLSMLKGAFVLVTGEIAPSSTDAMTIRTPVGTIGIRGTKVGGALDASNGLVLSLLPDPAGRPAAVVLSNGAGTQFLTEANTGIQIASYNTAPSAPQPISNFNSNPLTDVLVQVLSFMDTTLSGPIIAALQQVAASQAASRDAVVNSVSTTGEAGNTATSGSETTSKIIVSSTTDTANTTPPDFVVFTPVVSTVGSFSPTVIPQGTVTASTSQQQLQQQSSSQAPTTPITSPVSPTVSGSPGTDTTPAPSLTLSGSVITGSDLGEYIIGTAGSDYLDGRGGNDTILGLTGIDTIYGGNGDDIIQISELGANVTSGFYGSDSIYYYNSDKYGAITSFNLYIDGGTGNDTVIASLPDGGENHTILMDGYLTNVETLQISLSNLTHDTVIYVGKNLVNSPLQAPEFTGSTNANLMISVNSSNLTRGLVLPGTNMNGNDTIYGTHLTDYIATGAGNDVIYASGGGDQIFAGNGNDKIVLGYSFQNNTIISGGAGDDTVIYSTDSKTTGNFIYYGGSGKDLLDLGAASSVSLSGTQIISVDEISFSSYDSSYSLLLDSSAIATADGNSDGTTGDILLHLTDEVSSLDISITGSGGNIFLEAAKSGTASQQIYFTGGSGNDTIHVASFGFLEVNAGSGNDHLIIDESQALYEGYEGYLTMGAGNDSVYFTISDIFSRFDLDGGEGTDALNLMANHITYADGGLYYRADLGNMNLYGIERINVYVDPSVPVNNGTLTISNNSMNQDGILEIKGFQTSENLQLIENGAVNTNLSDGTATSLDFLISASSSTSSAYGIHVLGGFAGNDTMVGGTADDTLSGGDGNDQLMGRGGNNILYGGAGDDTIYASDTLGSGTGTNWLIGGDGNDTLYGNGGGNFFHGGNGADVFLSVGTASDLFYYQSTAEGGNSVGVGADTIYGFDTSNDVIRLKYGGFYIFSVEAGTNLFNGSGADYSAYASSVSSSTAPRLTMFNNDGTYQLIYDSNGATAGGEHVLAVFSGGAYTLTGSNFEIDMSGTA